MKHLVDVDEDALARAQRRLGATTIKATVNAALRMAAGPGPFDAGIEAALATLASVEFEDRGAAWR